MLLNDPKTKIVKIQSDEQWHAKWQPVYVHFSRVRENKGHACGVRALRVQHVHYVLNTRVDVAPSNLLPCEDVSS